MLEMGKGHTALSMFCRPMNLPLLMQNKSFNEMQDKLSEVHKQVADISMQNVPNEFRFSEAEGEIYQMTIDAVASAVGTWQKRGPLLS